MEKKSFMVGVAVASLLFLFGGVVIAYTVTLTSTNAAWVTAKATTARTSEDELVTELANKAIAAESKKNETQQFLRCVYKINEKEASDINRAYDAIKDLCGPTTTTLMNPCKPDQTQCLTATGTICCMTETETCRMGVGCEKK